MKLMISAICLVASLTGSCLAYAGPENVKWIAQCVQDNKREDSKEEAVIKYCACLNEKMGDADAPATALAEKVDPKAPQVCAKKADLK